MKEFKIGDRIKLIKDRNHAKAGMTGRIVADMEFGDWGIKFDEKSDGGYDLRGKCEDGYGQWIAPDEMELIPSFKVGQIYRVCKGEEQGNIIKIIAVFPDGDIHYKVIRGEALSCKVFHKKSPFVQSLAPLTGKKIGEAIRKWDADHAKKLEPEYNEVKRSAKVGEKIKVVAPEIANGYEVGEIGIVAEVLPTRVIADFENGRHSIFDREYVVLEPNAGVREVKRHAKVGDTIKIVRGDYGSSAAKIGAIGKVVRADGKGVGAKFPPYTEKYHVPYPIPHGNYEIISAGKHSYTAEQIEHAKKLCGEMIVEAFGNGKTFGLHFLDKNKDEDTNCVECELAIFDEKNVATVAKCSGHDKYNVWIGRCVALCKALHKPIPAFIMSDGKSRHFSFEKAKMLGYRDNNVAIHCKSEMETHELAKALDALGYKWGSGHKLTDLFYEDNITYYAYDSKKVYQGNGCAGEKHAEFSDCFTED